MAVLNSSIIKLKKLFKKYIEINKQIIDIQSIAVVPSKKLGEIPIDDVDIEDDFIFFCFAKFTKTMIAIDKLIKAKLYEDALT